MKKENGRIDNRISYNLIFLTDSSILLTTREYNNWQDIQNEYDNYMTSISFCTIEEVWVYLQNEYKLSNDEARNSFSARKLRDQKIVTLRQ